MGIGREASEAPKERVNIVYRPANNMDEEVELPLKLVMTGDYTGRADATPLEDRKPVPIDKDNFNEVMEKHKLSVTFAARNKLTGGQDDVLPVTLAFSTLKDFEPEAIARQVPDLRKLLDLRQAVAALKGPLGDKRAFVEKIRHVLGDEAARQRLIQELGLGAPSGEKE
jgi:type VI secretion system protein ImpB